MKFTQLDKWTKNPKIIDLLDLDTFQDHSPYKELNIIRDNYPIYWNPEGDSGFWNVTKYSDVQFVSSRPDLFSSSKGISVTDDITADASAETAGDRRTLIVMDPPKNIKYRRIISSWFTAKKTLSYQKMMNQLIDNHINNISSLRECDFANDFANKVTTSVLCKIFGIPQEDENRFIRWSNMLIGINDPSIGAMTSDEEAKYFSEIFSYCRWITNKKRNDPQDDIMTAMVNAEIDGKSISYASIEGFFILMLVAGSAERNAITGGMKLLIENPSQRELLSDNPKIINTAVEEIIRWVSPFHHMKRVAVQDVEIQGQKISKDDKVVMWYSPANRDKEIFKDPDNFNILRNPNNHLSFGYGQHHCLGIHVSRLQLQLIFNKILFYIPNMEINGNIQRLRSNSSNGINYMPIKY